jgi:beta-N-acetylhexosaminidase
MSPDGMTAPLRQQIKGLDAASAAARLTWMVLPGPELDDTSRALLERGIGGVVLFSANITGAAQLMGLTAELRRCATGPLRIAIDHEGGHVARIGAPVTRFPSAMAIGATGSEDLAYAVARAAGEELASLGIDVNLAPVLDVASDPRNPSVGARSFGSSPDAVARLGAATVRGYRDAGIAATAKHFPGHGRTPIDSHVDLPTVTGGLDELRRSDLPPFRAAFQAEVDLVMASHVAFEGLTDGLPSTLAAPIMKDLLRDELGFRGLLVTDAMGMRALAARHAIPEACVRSIAAGADTVMPIEQQDEVLRALAAAIESGVLPEQRVEEALARIAELDARLTRSVDSRAPRGDGAMLPDAAHSGLAGLVAQRSLTLVAGADLLPIAPSTSVAVIEFASRRASPVEELDSVAPTVAAALSAYLPRVREVIVRPGELAAASRLAAIEAAAAAELVILATRDAYVWPDECDLIARIAGSDRPTLLVALRNPYDLDALPRTTGAVAAYADVPQTLEALADALTGRAGWPGSLPIELARMSGLT